MKAYDFEAVTYDADIYCVDCLPEGITADSGEVSPIFADSEWDSVPVCCVCGAEHDYVTVLNEDDSEPEIEPSEGDLYTEDFVEFFECSLTAGPKRLRKPAFTVPDGEEWQDAVRRYQDSQQYWGNVWRVSDHGNIELVDWN